jgi:hypothetical protein
MTTFTELVATVVVHSSALALSHFGVTMEPALVDKAPPPPVERVVARTPTPVQRKIVRLTSCPQPAQLPHPIRT